MLSYFALVKGTREKPYLHFSHVSAFFWPALEQIAVLNWKLTSSGNYSSIYSLRWERSQESMCWKHTEATQNSEQVAPGFVQMGLGNSKNKNLQPLGILFQCLIILRVTLFFFLYPVGSLSFKSCPSPLFCTSVESSLLGHPFDIYWQGEVAIPEAFSCLDLKKP